MSRDGVAAAARSHRQRAADALSLSDLKAAVRFALRIPGDVRRRVTREQAHMAMRTRLEQRERRFLISAERNIYGNPHSPYRPLLEQAGCTYGDLVDLVQRAGLDAALRQLFEAGVYLTVAEYRGRQPVQRGGVSYSLQPGQWLNPRFGTASQLATSGGSAGAPTALPFERTSDVAVNTFLNLEAGGPGDWAHAIWLVPGGWALNQVLNQIMAGGPIERWFSQIDPADPRLHPRYLWSTRVLRWGGLLGGTVLPRPEPVSLEDPLPIARWMQATLQRGRIPCLRTLTSPAVRLCLAAHQAGIDLRGAWFIIAGEPVTAARLAAIERVGARARTSYAATEAPSIGAGCLAPAFADEVHVRRDHIAYVRPEAPVAGVPAGALLLTSIDPNARSILLNVSIGDQVELVQRSCGCYWEGWYGVEPHFHTIRSFEKLTVGGMMVLDATVIDVLERTLPARFGGGPTDYQLREEQSEEGEPRLVLVIHPSVGPLDEDAAVDCFLSTIGQGVSVNRVAELQWRSAGFVRVERRAPGATEGGKILHLVHTPTRRLAGVQ